MEKEKSNNCKGFIFLVFCPNLFFFNFFPTFKIVISLKADSEMPAAELCFSSMRTFFRAT